MAKIENENIFIEEGDFVAKTIPSFDEVTQSALEFKIYTLADEPTGLHQRNTIYSSATDEITDTNLANNFIFTYKGSNRYGLELPYWMDDSDEQTYANLISAEWKDNITQKTGKQEFYFLYDKNYKLSTNKNLSAFLCNNWTVMRNGVTYPGYIPGSYTLNELGFGSLLDDYTVLKSQNMKDHASCIMFIRFNTAGNILVINHVKDNGGSLGYKAGFLLVPKSATIEYFNDPNGNVE